MQLINEYISSAAIRSKLSSVFLKEEQYFVKTITSKSERIKVHNLRHRIFCQELGWVSETSTSLEIDEYDENAVFVGVFDAHHNFKAFLRIVTSAHTFMLEKEFPFLLKQDYTVRKENDTVEISRLCVEPGARSEKISGNFGVHYVSMFLYKGVYHWCLKNKIRYLYMVVEEKIYRLLCAKGFPFKLVGEPKVMPDGVIAVAAMLDWREFEENGKANRPKMFAWFSQNQLYLPITRLQQHDTDLPHQVFS